MIESKDDLKSKVVCKQEMSYSQSNEIWELIDHSRAIRPALAMI